MSDLVTVKRGGATIQIMLNRPERRNALDLPTLTELLVRVNEAAKDPNAHVVVLHGAGEGFCSGADLGTLGELAGQESPIAAFQPGVEMFQQIIHGLATAPKITIAAMHGFALGSGLDLALACDLRLAAAGTQLACSHVNHGLIPTGGATWALPRLIGLSPAMAMMLSGDPMDAEGAYRLGLIHRRVLQGKHVEEALRWAEELSHRSLPSQAAIKRLARIDPRLTLSAALKEEWEAQRRLLDDREPEKYIPAEPATGR